MTGRASRTVAAVLASFLPAATRIGERRLGYHQLSTSLNKSISVGGAMKHRITGFGIGPPRRGRESLSLVQILRALAALAVALDHLTFELARQFKWQAAPFPFSAGSAGVDVFFVISGFVIVYVSEPLFGKPWAPACFLGRRLARIVPLYWSTTAVVLLDDLMRHADLAAANLSLASVAASF